jgi:hypothetical protein
MRGGADGPERQRGASYEPKRKGIWTGMVQYDSVPSTAQLL